MKSGRISAMTVNLLIVLAAAASAQTKDAIKPTSAKKARVLVLGVFHMANPGKDVFNLQVDDVLAPKRQGAGRAGGNPEEVSADENRA